ncbi:MAG: MarR family transcriptional regulator [Mucilaginibacter sp.]|nr:MarR family transcriptional regulator [Mucilaginibacter sp.]
MDFYNKVGKMALGSRLRGLSDKITNDAAQVYGLYTIDMQPRWFPVFYVLSKTKESSITEIAREIGHTHPSVSQIVREMAKSGYVIEQKSKEDQRKNNVALSKKGREMAVKIEAQYADVSAAIEGAFRESQYDLWKAIEEWEYLLEQKSLFKRVQDERKKRESGMVTIVDYSPEYQADFRRLNEEWITQYFKMEEYDYKALDHPKEYILDQGGYIFIALYEGEALGTCALIKMDGYKYELAKMAVSPKAQGKNIGTLLGYAAIEKCRELGIGTIYLESNTILKPAINLYRKLGFEKITGVPSPYERCNIQMELKVK